MASHTHTLRKTLSASGLVRLLRCRFRTLPDPRRRQGKVVYSLSDTLLAAFAMFQFKCPSLLAFDKATRGEPSTLSSNLKRLYRLSDVACDTQMRTILDRVSFDSLRPAFRAVHSAVQRGRVLEDFKVLEDRLLVSIDGTGLFSSAKVRCRSCGVKERRDGTEEYYHQLLAAVIVSPDQPTVLPLDFEPIVKSDGETKDCSERNAAARLVPSIAAQYPKRRFVVLEDALAANGPHVRLLKKHGMDFIIGVKPKGSTHLFAAFDRRCEREQGDAREFEQRDEQGVIRGVRIANALELNASHRDVSINLIEFWELKPAKKKDAAPKLTNWSWITNIELTPQNAFDIARLARSRWKIENQTFNTLKNQGYHFEHNYGHGQEQLSSTLAGLMLLAFLCDQVQEHACGLFKAARSKTRTKENLWNSMLVLLEQVEIPSWELLWRALGGQGAKVVLDTG